MKSFRNFLHALWTTACYTGKSVIRQRTFLLCALLSCAAVVFNLHIKGQFWESHAVPSMIPFSVIVFVTLIQALFIYFIASETFSEDSRNDSTDALYVRPFSNAAYIAGKAAGVFAVAGGLTVLLLIIAAILDALIISDTPVFWAGYLYYFLLIWVPSALFFTGFSAVVSIRCGRSSLAAIMFLPVVIVIVALGGSYGGLFDIPGLHLPMLYSDFIGFGNLDILLAQRLMIAVAGLLMTAVTIVLMPRYPQSKRSSIPPPLFALAFFAAAVFCGTEYHSDSTEQTNLRHQARSIAEKWAHAKTVSIRAMDLSVVHKGASIDCTARVTIENNDTAPLEMYVLALNSGLAITAITTDGRDIPYIREGYIAAISPQRPLAPGHIDSLTIAYTGSIRESDCYRDIDDVELLLTNRWGFCVIDKRYGFLAPRYVLLTPETAWYPQANTTAWTGPDSKLTKDFVRFSMTVETSPGLTPISQGECTKTGEGVYYFQPETPLPGLTLAIGEYEDTSIDVDGIGYHIRYLKGHDFFSRHFTNLSHGRLEKKIREIKNEIEVYQTKLDYPYRRFSLVEVPIQFLAHSRFWKLSPETVQPEMMLIPEKGMFLGNGADFDFALRNIKRNIVTNTQMTIFTPEEFEAEMIEWFCKEIFYRADYGNYSKIDVRKKRSHMRLSMENLYARQRTPFTYMFTFAPLYFNYQFDLSSDTCPYLGTAMEYFFISQLRMIQFFNWDTVISSRLLKLSLHDALNSDSEAPYLYDYMKRKSEELVMRLKVENAPAFDERYQQFLSENRFQQSCGDKFIAVFADSAGISFNSLYDSWMNTRGLPSITIASVEADETVTDGRHRFEYAVSLANASEIPGVARASILTSDGVVERMVLIAGNSVKRFFIETDSPGSRLYFRGYNTVDRYGAINIPRYRVDTAGKAFSTETTLPLTPDGTGLIIDDNDPGFAIVSQPPRGLLTERIGRKDTEDVDVTIFDRRKPPELWTKTLDPASNNDRDFYGRTMKSATCIKSGKGEARVAWKAAIEEGGEYDVFYHSPSPEKFYYFISATARRQPVKDMHFFVHSTEGVDEVVADIETAKAGWNLLGTFNLEQGETRIELTDESSGEFVFADAVKLVKK